MSQSLKPQGVGNDVRAAVLLTAGLAMARLVALFKTPLELYPDEAQYWLWSRTLDFGYYSKPPMIAWAIWATTALGGDAEPWVRLSANLFQAGAAFVVFLIGLRLHLAVSKTARSAWTVPAAFAALAAFAAILAPNAAWNATHGFATLQHTAQNAAWNGVQLFNLSAMGAFVGSQFGIGPN